MLVLLLMAGAAEFVENSRIKITGTIKTNDKRSFFFMPSLL
jgi:hypothetical protein